MGGKLVTDGAMLFCYAAETWTDPTTTKLLQTTHRALGGCCPKISQHSQHLACLRNSDLRNLSHLRDPEEHASMSKHI
ncbi:hypothetical protein KIN20_035296 [Parelaphostrongylus tenuis]|uniref:Uncharacterized protein n=1 Tax=Parelaphostrongylus tenuis TaxID=148309 RepID=A0AAD5RBL8_PARTN|nr:hypothetical protein KIN20_035296 [Parelaphostrongylus tenuis]